MSTPSILYGDKDTASMNSCNDFETTPPHPGQGPRAVGLCVLEFSTTWCMVRNTQPSAFGDKLQNQLHLKQESCFKGCPNGVRNRNKKGRSWQGNESFDPHLRFTVVSQQKLQSSRIKFNPALRFLSLITSLHILDTELNFQPLNSLAASHIPGLLDFLCFVTPSVKNSKLTADQLMLPSALTQLPWFIHQHHYHLAFLTQQFLNPSLLMCMR